MWFLSCYIQINLCSVRSILNFLSEKLLYQCLMIDKKGTWWMNTIKCLTVGWTLQNITINFRRLIKFWRALRSVVNISFYALRKLVLYLSCLKLSTSLISDSLIDFYMVVCHEIFLLWLSTFKLCFYIWKSWN